jgi:hypothetical protein
MSAPLIALALNIASMVCAALLGARLLASYPHRRSAQLIALIAVCDICFVALAHFEYRYWIRAVSFRARRLVWRFELRP